MSKILFLVQYYPYQYEQFKCIIDNIDCDVYYRLDTTKDSRYNFKFNILTNIRDGNKLDLSKFDSRLYINKNYDYIIYTGGFSSTTHKLAELTKYSFGIYYSHSLVGTSYDIKLCQVPRNFSGIGIYPKLWTEFKQFKLKNINKINNKYVITQSYPIVHQCIDYKSKYSVEDNTLGVIFRENSEFTEYLDIFSSTNYSKYYIKFHPLTSDNNIQLFNNIDNINIINKFDNKYDFTDRVKDIYYSASSLSIESYLRNIFYKKNQSFMKNISGKLHKTNLLDKYSDLLISKEIDDIISEQLYMIRYIEMNYI